MEWFSEKIELQINADAQNVCSSGVLISVPKISTSFASQMQLA